MARLEGGIYHRGVTEGGDAGPGRSTAIVLFTDVVGSTELRSRLGDDAAEVVRRRHDRLVTEAIEANRGRLVKNLGDGLMATFAGASDAVAAAVRIQQALDRYNRSADSVVAVELRVGISAGDVAFEEGDCFGTPVIEAARLCGAARGGQILVTDVVRWLAGSTGGHRFAPIGALELKGLPAPVPAGMVTWEPLPQSSVPLPALLTDIGRIFVGREAQVERLEQLWKEAAAGERRVALLAGEAGVGKTRLAAELATRVHEGGATVLAGRCDEDLGVPYQPFVEALRHFVDHTPTADLTERLGRYGGELVRLMPELAERPFDLAPPLQSDPETERYRLFDAVATWLAAASAEGPVLLVLDDLQWAAKPTLLLLRHLLRSAVALRVLFVATYRDTDVGHGHPLREVVADLRRQVGLDRLSLTGLDPSAVVAFMEQDAGHSLDEGDILVAQAVYQETEGNPFFVREVLRHLKESGRLRRREGREEGPLAVDALGIPESVRDVVGRRLSRLSADTNEALRIAAVTGTEFELAVLQAVGEFADNVLLSAVEEATLARLTMETVPARRYRFAHALVRDTMYEELSAARRVALHRRVAEAIEAIHGGALDDYLPALAHHWSRASAPGAKPNRAIDYATRAGHRALSQLANDEAASYYRQALDLLVAGEVAGKDDHRLELLISLGEAQRRAGDPLSRQTLLGAVALAQALGDAEALARAAMANTRGVYWSTGLTGADTERVAALEAALKAIGDEPTGVRARLLATLSLELVFTPDRHHRVQLSDEALRIARSLDDPAALAQVLVTRAWTINAPDTLGDRLAGVAELLTLAAELDDPVLKFRAHFLRARITLETGEFDDGNEHFEKARAIAEELGQPTLRFTVSWLAVGHVFRSGLIGAAERVAQAAFEIGESSSQPDALQINLLQRCSIRLEQDRLGELTAELSDLAAQHPGMPGLTVVLAAAYCNLGRDDDALDCLEPLAATSFELPHDPLWLGYLAFAVEVISQLRCHRHADALYDLLRPYGEQFPVLVAVSRPSTGHFLGMLAALMGRDNEAEDHFSAAERLHIRLHAPGFLARTRLEWARLLLTRRRPGDAERALELLGQALATARELGLTNVERQALALLA